MLWWLFIDTVSGNRLCVPDSNDEPLGAIETRAQRGDESEMRALFGHLEGGDERVQEVKGLARDGTRLPSGARSTQPQPDGPDL